MSARATSRGRSARASPRKPIRMIRTPYNKVGPPGTFVNAPVGTSRMAVVSAVGLVVGIVAIILFFVLGTRYDRRRYEEGR